jgi:hypothetical protein
MVDEGLLKYATYKQRCYLEAVEKYGSGLAAEKALGLGNDTVSKALRLLRRRAAEQGYSPQHNMIHEVPEGYKVKRVSSYYNREGKKTGQWVIATADHEDRIAAMLAQVEGARDDILPIVATTKSEPCDQDLMTIYPVGDPHCGLYAWEDETGQSFDLKEFERVQCAAIDRLVDSVPRSAIALFNDKGDTTHANNNKNRTPRSGHELDVQGRHGEAMRMSVRVKRYQIAKMLTKHDQVILRIDPGNHDPEASQNLVLILEALYENEPRVTVITVSNPYWYYLFGKNLIGTCHGDGAKGKDLPGIMAQDARELWGLATYCVWFVGHVHHKDIKEYTGCTVEYMRTMAAPDYHSHSSGYRSRRTMEAITLHKTDAEVERHTCSLSRLG